MIGCAALVMWAGFATSLADASWVTSIHRCGLFFLYLALGYCAVHSQEIGFWVAERIL